MILRTHFRKPDEEIPWFIKEMDDLRKPNEETLHDLGHLQDLGGHNPGIPFFTIQYNLV